MILPDCDTTITLSGKPARERMAARRWRWAPVVPSSV
jgi:hypothetical protein